MARVEEDIQQMEDRPLCEGRRKIADISASSKTSSHFKLFKAYGRLKMLTHKDKNSDSKSHSDTNELCRLEDSPFRLLKVRSIPCLKCYHFSMCVCVFNKFSVRSCMLFAQLSSVFLEKITSIVFTSFLKNFISVLLFSVSFHVFF